jgi:two-component system sensor histidine kinase/response regulator
VGGGGATAAKSGDHPVLEVMNPLNALVGFASMLADVGHDLTPEQRHRYAVRVRDAADVLGRMMTSLVQTLQQKDIDLGEEWASSGTFRVSPPSASSASSADVNATADDGASPSSIPPALDTEHAARPRVFIVDSDGPSRDLLAAYLEGRGYELVLLASGEDARREAEGCPPDLVVLDPFGEGDAGLVEARALKTSNPSGLVPLLFVTALADDDSRVRALSAGAEQIVAKPVNRHELRAGVKNLLHLRAQQGELAVQNSQLKSLQRFKDETTAMLLHDLKGPLTAMKMNLDFALGDMPEQIELADARGALWESRAAADKIFRIIANLLDIARSEDGRLVPKKEKVDIDALLARVTREYAAEAQSRKVTITHNSVAMDAIDADADLIGRAIGNLVENALRFTLAGGSVVLSARQTAKTVELLMENDGKPISPEWRPLVFEKYVQASAASGLNRGIGLYFCRVAVEAHGGKITLVSGGVSPEQAAVAGPEARAATTCFKITLPRS